MKPNLNRTGLASIAALFVFGSFQAAFAGDPSCVDPAVPLSALLMPPPRHDSAQTKAELQELLRMQEARTSDQVKHARDDDRRTVESFLGGIGIKSEKLSSSATHFFDCIAEAVEHAVREAKLTFMRTRPYRLPDNKLHTLKKLSDRDSSSYPSGHATYGTVVGLILAEMLPEKKEELYKRIQDYGHSRLVSGAHFRSDVYAGKIAGAAIAASLLGKESFRTEFNEVKAELRRVIGFSS